MIPQGRARWPTIVLVFVIAASGAAGQLPNDVCSGALPIGEGTFSGFIPPTTGTDTVPLWCATIVHDVWVLYTPSCTGTAVVSTCTLDGGYADFAMVLGAYTGSCTALVQIACAYYFACNQSVGGPSRISFPVTAGSSVYIRIGGSPYTPLPSSGNLTLVVSCTLPPPNDECGSALVIGEGVTTGLTDAATSSPVGAPSCGAILDDVWYGYIPSCTGGAVASFCLADGGAATFWGEIVAYEGTCTGGLTEIGCSKGAPGGCGPRASFPVTASVPVYLRVGGAFANQHGAFQLGVTCGPSPPNDTCANAIPLQTGVNGPFSNVGATDGSNPGWSYCAYLGQATWSPGYSDVWFSWTATCGARVQINLCPSGSNFYPFLSRRASCGTNEIGCTGSCQYTYPLVANVTAGTTYYFRVASPYGHGAWPPGWVEGQFTINLSCLWTLTMNAPGGPGSFLMQSFDGTPLHQYFTAVTLAPQVSPSFFGLDISLAELLTEWTWPGGFPFNGFLDSSGDSQPFLIPVGVPSGLPVHAVSLYLDAVSGLPIQATPPISFTTP